MTTNLPGAILLWMIAELKLIISDTLGITAVLYKMHEDLHLSLFFFVTVPFPHIIVPSLELSA